MADNLTPEQRSRTMSRIRSKNTQVELRVRRLLHSKGYRYRVHPHSIPGKPDIAFTARKVAVFIDGDFWHGWKFADWAEKLAPYWRAKIERNMLRDEQNQAHLEREGWTVLRIWEHEIKQDVESCVTRIEQTLLNSAGAGRKPKNRGNR